MRAASQLPGKGPTDVDDAPDLHVNQKSDYDDADGWSMGGFSCILLVIQCK